MSVRLRSLGPRFPIHTSFRWPTNALGTVRRISAKPASRSFMPPPPCGEVAAARRWPTGSSGQGRREPSHYTWRKSRPRKSQKSWVPSCTADTSKISLRFERWEKPKRWVRYTVCQHLASLASMAPNSGLLGEWCRQPSRESEQLGEILLGQLGNLPD